MKWRKGYKAYGYMNAILFHGTDPNRLSAASYHNIKDDHSRRKKFYTFAVGKFPEIQYVNWYNATTKQFIKQVQKKDFEL
jgi:hypothetical protein